MGPFLPIAVVVLAIGAAYAQSKRSKKGELTPERATIFETAINSVEEPAKLRALAVSFEKEGLKKQADLLRKRADLREMPADVKAARREVFRKAASSSDPVAVLKVADAFEKEGAIGAASKLREYAAQLQASIS